MCARFATPQIVVVHRRQIVMHQRISVHHLHRCGNPRGTGLIDAEQRCAFHHQEGPQPLPAAQRGIAHRLGQPAFRALDRGQQNVESLLNGRGGARHFFVKIDR